MALLESEGPKPAPSVAGTEIGNPSDGVVAAAQLEASMLETEGMEVALVGMETATV